MRVEAQRVRVRALIVSDPGKREIPRIGAVDVDLGQVGNDLALTLAGDVVVSNFQPTMSGLRGAYFMIRSGLGWPTGDVIVWHASEGWRHVAGTSAAGANGIAVSPDGKTLFYAETGAGRVARVPLAGLPAGAAPVSVQSTADPAGTWQ